jgi:hypothetical protein
MAGTRKLIFVGGAPGVGKSATCERLYRSLPNSICVDGDDLWCRMNPFRVDRVTTSMIEKNLAAVLRNFLEADFDYVILCWVLHLQEIVDRLLGSLQDLEFSFSWFTLVCDEETLRHRWAERPLPCAGLERALHRLRQTRQLEKSRIVDNTAMSIEEVVKGLSDAIEEPQPGNPADRVRPAASRRSAPGG